MTLRLLFVGLTIVVGSVGCFPSTKSIGPFVRRIDLRADSLHLEKCTIRLRGKKLSEESCYIERVPLPPNVRVSSPREVTPKAATRLAGRLRCALPGELGGNCLEGESCRDKLTCDTATRSCVRDEKTAACERLIRAWHNNRDAQGKALVERRMSASCRSRLPKK